MLDPPLIEGKATVLGRISVVGNLIRTNATKLIAGGTIDVHTVEDGTTLS